MANIAILGFGVVGAGTAELLTRNAEKVAAAAAEPVRLKYICDVRDFPDSPFSDLLVKDFGVIERDPDIQIVAECIGGSTVAYEFTKRCLLAGKNVVTSNKELVAEYGDELLGLARRNNLNYLFEASVGGGIPILRPLSQCLAANNILEILGILNGTTNFILTYMRDHHTSFPDALLQAQALGYAEKDPTDDVEGRDACRKLCILASLAFGWHVAPERVPTEGIIRVNREDMDFAEKHGYRIKLLGRAVRREQGLELLVAPHMVPEHHPLGVVEDVYNGILVTGDAVGDVLFCGRGAGASPTASAVVADIIDVCKHFKARKYLFWGSRDEAPALPILPPDSEPTEWYTRADGGYRMRILK